MDDRTFILNENGVWALGRLGTESNLSKMDCLKLIIVKISSDGYAFACSDTNS